MPNDIRMSDQVRELLGAEMARHVLAVALSAGRCPVCREPLPPDGPVNVVVSRNGQNQAVLFAHVSCAPSTVVQARRPVDLAAATGMSMTAILMQDDHGFLAGLVGERQSSAYMHSSRGGELIDVGMADVLRRGFELISRLGVIPRTALDWTATITGPTVGACRLLINPEALFYDGDVLLPPGWREAGEARGGCVLYAGTGLSDPATGDLTVQRLDAAAAAGNLAAARLPITWTSAP